MTEKADSNSALGRTVSIRFRAEDYQRLQAEADKAKRTLSDFLRLNLLEQFPDRAAGDKRQPSLFE